MNYSFEIPGVPSTNHRPRFSTNGRRVHARKDASYMQYLERVSLFARAGRPSRWPLDRRYAVFMSFAPPDKRRRDLDNVIKGVLDGMTGFVFDDDSQVDALTITRATVNKTKPSVIVRVEVIDG